MGLLKVLNLPSLRGKGVQPATVVHAKDEKAPIGLSRAATAWRQAHGQAVERVSALKTSIRSHYASGHPHLLQAIEKGLFKLDEVFAEVDHRLADSLEAAAKADTDAARVAELAKAKRILAGYVGYINGQPMIGRLDKNPFVKTDVKALLLKGLNEAAKAL